LESEFNMQVKTDQISTAKLEVYFKGKLENPDLMDTTRVPRILWRVADAAAKFCADTTIVSSMTTVNTDTFHKCNVKIVYQIARHYDTVKRACDDKCKDALLTYTCDTPTAVHIFLTGEQTPHQVTRMEAAQVLITLAQRKGDSSTMQPLMLYYDLCRIKEIIDAISMHAMLSTQQLAIFFGEGLAEWVKKYLNERPITNKNQGRVPDESHLTRSGPITCRDATSKNTRDCCKLRKPL
jgi:hypothetical protein